MIARLLCALFGHRWGDAYWEYDGQGVDVWATRKHFCLRCGLIDRA